MAGQTSAGPSVLVEIAGVTRGLFTSVDGLESRSEVITHLAGGDPVARKVPGRASYGNLVLRRLYGGDDALRLWRKTVEDGAVRRTTVGVALHGPDGAELVRFTGLAAWPCRWRLTGLDPQAGGVVEEVEVVVERIERA
jgi:phage tail-like protein